MFALADFVRKTVLGMVGREPSYKVREYALNWYERSTLSDSDMVELEQAITAYESSLITPDTLPEEWKELLPEPTEPSEPKPADWSTWTFTEAGLCKQSVAHLKEYIETHDIETNATKKHDLIKAILGSL